MSILNQDECVLLIIDIQEKLLNAVFNKEELEKNALIMTNAANILDIPTLLTEQYPKGLGETLKSIKNVLNNNTKFYEKITFSALDLDILKSDLKQLGRKQVVVFGIETHICVNQTINALIDEGYDVTVIEDASGSRTEKQHIAGLNRIKENGAKSVTAEIALFEWLKTAKHPKFKEIQALIK